MNKTNIIFAILAFAVIAGCTKPFRLAPDDDSEYITLSLGVSGAGETKASSTNNIYGIQVQYDSQKDGNIDAPYAYGLFDNTNDMTILLLKGYHYKFVCTMVKNGKNVLYYGQYGSNTFPGYAKPFQRSNSESTALGNRFIYKSEDEDCFSGLGWGTATIKSPSGYEEPSMPSIERYYGQYDGYAPRSGDVVTIPLKKTVFGIRLIIEKVPEGSLNALFDGELLSGNSTPSLKYDSGVRLFSFSDVYNCWYTDNYEQKLNAYWSFKSSIFSGWDQTGGRQLSIRRNVLSTVTISYTPDNASGYVGMIEEELNENNIYLFVNSDGVIEIGIQPLPEE